MDFYFLAGLAGWPGLAGLAWPGLAWLPGCLAGCLAAWLAGLAWLAGCLAWPGLVIPGHTFRYEVDLSNKPELP